MTERPEFLPPHLRPGAQPPPAPPPPYPGPYGPGGGPPPRPHYPMPYPGPQPPPGPPPGYRGPGGYPPPAPYPPPGPPGPPPYGPYGQYPMPYPRPYPPPPKPKITFEGKEYRLHWATALLRALGILVVTVGVFLPMLSSGRVLAIFLLCLLPLTAGAFTYTFLSWWQVRFWISGDDLVYSSGLIRRKTRTIPLSRLQAVDVVQPVLLRVFGLAEVRLELAGGDQGEVKFSMLGKYMAEQLRAALLAHAAGLSGYTPEAPEQRFYRVPFLTLFAGLLLRIPVLISVLLFVALVLIGFIGQEPGVAAGAVPAFLGLLRGVVAPLLTYTLFTVSLSPDGLRLRYGLLGTRMQTVPPGRVHAVRIVEPGLWRSFGWARVEVTVAGYVGGQQMRTAILLPVAPRRVAFSILSMVFPGTDVAKVRLLPAARGLLGSAAAGTDDVVFVSRRGWVCHTLDVVAHARAQSMQFSVGPWQRLRGLATVYVDTPPGPVRLAAPNRPLEEARAIVESEAWRARRARDAADQPERWAVKK